MKRARGGFTLIEMLMALAACAVILAAVYGVFSKAIHLRDAATERVRDARIRARAIAVLRNDLRNGFVSGGTLAASLLGSAESHGASFPGYLKFTATTARNPADAIFGDVQEVAYYVATDPAAADQKAGRLVRTTDQNILATTRDTPPEQPLLNGVEAMEISFFDGTSWQPSWEFTTDNQTLPEAVRVTIRFAPKIGGGAPAPIEVLVPWTTAPAFVPTA